MNVLRENELTLTPKESKYISGRNYQKLSLPRTMRKKWFFNLTIQFYTKLLKGSVEIISNTLTTQIERL